jgi:hypothetical protein
MKVSAVTVLTDEVKEVVAPAKTAFGVWLDLLALLVVPALARSPARSPELDVATVAEADLHRTPRLCRKSPTAMPRLATAPPHISLSALSRC